MKDIPLFEAAGGLVSLTLSQIPATGTAWALIRSYDPDRLTPLLADCRTMLGLCGAKTRYISAGAKALPGLEEAYQVLTLALPRAKLPDAADSGLSLLALTPAEADDYAACYNQVFAGVLHARPCSPEEARMLAAEGRGYLARLSGGAVCGFGAVQGAVLQAVGLLPGFRGRGLGRALTALLLEQTRGDPALLQTTSVNAAALALYDSLGFAPAGPPERWYRL